MSGSVFHSMLPLNFSEFSPYLTVLVLGSWTRSIFYSKIVECGPTFRDITQKGGIFLKLGICRLSKAKCNS